MHRPVTRERDIIFDRKHTVKKIAPKHVLAEIVYE